MLAQRKPHPWASTKIDLKRFDDKVAEYGLERPKSQQDIVDGRKLAADMIDPGVASVGTFLAVQKYCDVGMLVFRENGVITGMAGLLNLTKDGVQALMLNTFDGPNPHFNHLARAGDNVYGSYAWAGAATTHASRAAVVTVGVGLRSAFYGDLPAFARAATPAGAAALIAYLKFKPMPGVKTLGMYYLPETVAFLEDAA
ncbi:MAG: hypothetical protein AAGA91_19670 [Pseudomonadota bacterium]